MAARYRIELAPAARRQFKKLPKDIKKKIAKAIDKLETNPYPNGVKKLSNEDNLYRIRVGDYRIVYHISNDELLILIVRVRHRKDIY